MHGLVTVHGHGGRQDFKDGLCDVILMSRDFYVNLVTRLLGRIEIGHFIFMSELLVRFSIFPNLWFHFFVSHI